MAFVTINLENLTELKTRVGNSSDTTLATILGITYPSGEDFVTYRWHNTALDTADDYEIVCPTPRIGLAGRWFRIDNAQLPQANADWNSVSGVSQILNKPTLNISDWNSAFSWGDHNTVGYLTENSFSTLSNKSGNISQWTNDSGYLTSVPTQTWASITGKPTTLSGYGITDAYPLSGNPSGFLTGITSGQVTTALGFTPYNNTNPNSYISRTGISAGQGISYNSSTGVISTAKKQETYSGTTNASGQYTVSFGTAYGAAPNIQANIINGTDTQTIRITAISTTGFTVLVRNRTDALGLLPSYSNVNGAAVDVLITEK